MNLGMDGIQDGIRTQSLPNTKRVTNSIEI